ncbi:MAG TPA: chemotaxis-specific protein-glutamate methyltransferase CheB, partial [Polyangiaceae bacterium]|nr:chemotaxis-specific protein-glutamate methyltransferase CheB [Polyangiaceae bacterium]
MSQDVVRVLVVDDSASVRSLIVKILDNEPGIRVVGTAASGVTAIDAIKRLAPDVVTLDVEMPGMDGMELLKRIRLTHPRLPVIMFSHLTQRGAVTTIDAMFHGATDFVGKPSNTGGAEAAREYVRTRLIPKLLAMKARPADAQRSMPPVPRAAPVSLRSDSKSIIAIGSSTGGPVVLDELVCALPRDFSIPVVVVQHMPSMFTKLLADRMSARARVSVVEATKGEPVVAGKVIIAPGDHHLMLRRDGGAFVAELIDCEPGDTSCPSVDMLFRSVARLCGSGAVGVVLTGMGSDGLEGSRSIVDAGGRVYVQDEASSVVWGMPGQIARAGLATAVLPV